MTDRLKAIGASAEFSPPALGESADKLLGTVLVRVEMMFDTGDDQAILAKNVKAKGVDLTKLDFVVLSHLHTYRNLLAQSDDLNDGGLEIVHLAQTK